MKKTLVLSSRKHRYRVSVHAFDTLRNLRISVSRIHRIDASDLDGLTYRDPLARPIPHIQVWVPMHNRKVQLHESVHVAQDVWYMLPRNMKRGLTRVEFEANFVAGFYHALRRWLDTGCDLGSLSPRTIETMVEAIDFALDPESRLIIQSRP